MTSLEITVIVSYLFTWQGKIEFDLLYSKWMKTNEQ